MAVVTSFWILDGLIFLSTLIVLAYMYMTRNFEYWKKRGVKEITPTPFVGNLGEVLRMKKSAGHWIQEIYKKGLGLPYIGFYIFDRPFFLVRDPELVKQILVRDFSIFNNRFAAASPGDVLGNGNMFFLKNPGWKLVRTKLSPIYTTVKLKKMFELMVEVGDDLDAHMESLKLGAEGKNVEIKDLCGKFTTDMIATTAFGLKVNSLSDPDAEFRKFGSKIFQFTAYRSFEFSSLFLMPQLAKFFGFKFFPNDTEVFFRKAVNSTLKYREESGIQRGDLLDLLLELKKNQAGPEKDIFDFNGDNLVAQAMAFFTGGFETTSSAISFLLYELAIHPEIQTKLRNEIQESLQDCERINYDVTMAIPYLDMVLSEALRKYPLLPVVDRVASMDYKIPNSDLILQKGTPVYISIYGLHYDPEYFPDPEKFDPERFSQENKKTRKSGIYIPFGDGPHACIGLRIGLLQAKLGVMKLLLNYEFSVCEKTLIPMRFDPKAFVTAPYGEIILNVRKIST